MKGFYSQYEKGKKITRIIATIEKSAGNETVGTAWNETSSFPIETPVSEIMKWAGENGISGRLIITPDLATEENTR